MQFYFLASDSCSEWKGKKLDTIASFFSRLVPTLHCPPPLHTRCTPSHCTFPPLSFPPFSFSSFPFFSHPEFLPLFHICILPSLCPIPNQIVLDYTCKHDITWSHMTSHNFTWSHDITWSHMTSHNFTWSHMTSLSQTSHDLTWHNCLTTSHDLTWPYMISHDIT